MTNIIRKSEGKYELQFMQKMATVAATADGLNIEGNNFKVGALIGCPDMVLFACERITELEEELKFLYEVACEGTNPEWLQEQINALKEQVK